MRFKKLALTLITPLPFLLMACASQPTSESAGAFKPVEVVYDNDRAIVYPVNGFRIDLLDNEYQCRYWAFGRDGRNMRPCAGEVPSCGAPIPFSEVTVVSSSVLRGDVTPRITFDTPSLVTEGVYHARIDATIQNTSRYLARQVAREGCDLLIVDGEEWVSIRRGNPVRYLQVRWGTKDSGAADQAAP